MKALILGAGYGTRLYPLTKNLPKPLLDIAGRPLLTWLLGSVEKLKEISEIYLVTNNRFYEHYERFLVDYPAVKPIVLVNDGSNSPDDRLGAVKDIQFVIQNKSIKDDLLIAAGDNLFDFALSGFIKAFKKYGTIITIKNLKGIDKDLISQYSVVTLDKGKRLVDFEEKPAAPESTLAALCLYVFGKDTLGLVNEYLERGFTTDAPGYYIQWLYRKIPVYGYEVKGEWFDIGDIDFYNKANDYYRSKFTVAARCHPSRSEGLLRRTRC